MMTVTSEQRRADMVSIKMAHKSPFISASFPSTATMQKVRIRIATGERQRCNSILFKIPRDPQFSPTPMGKKAILRHH